MIRRLLAFASILAGSALIGTALVQVSRTPAIPTRSKATQPIIGPDAFPSPDTGYSGGAPTGLRIRVADLGIDLPVVEGDGWNAPLNKAATYPGLKLPGQGGRSMIYAHARAGMFEPLFRARVGDLVDISNANGEVLHYEIKRYFPHWSSTDLTWLQPSASEELILVTCTTYNPNDPRIVAVAEPIP